MPKLIKNIGGEFFEHNTGSVLFLRPIAGQVQREDYINMFGFIAFLQNLTEVCETAHADIPLHFGLANQLNLTVVTLDFCYENSIPAVAPIDDEDTMAYYIIEYFSTT
jgi:hypothetical protein